MDNSKKHQKKKRSKHKQKSDKKNKYKHKNKNKNKNKKKHSKKEKKITKLSQINLPVEKLIPKCEKCNKKQSQFYCTKCEVYYCAKCEEQIHKISFLKKHKKHLYKAPYNELVKKTNFNICRKHNKELSLYCIDENKLICSECYSNCKINNHEILGLQDFSNEIYEKIKIILTKIKNEENQNKLTIQKSLENQNKLKEKIKNICQKIENDSDLMIQKIQDSKINHLNLFKKIEIIINTKIENILKDTEKKQKKISKKKIEINTVQKMKKDKNHIKLIQGGKEIIKWESKSEKKGRKKRKGKKSRKRDKEKEKEELDEKEKEEKKKNQMKKKKKEKKRRKGEKTETEKEKEKEKKSEEKEKEKEKEEFDPEMNYNNRIKLKNENKTAWNPRYGGKICGKKIYSSGKHEIKIKIDQFPNSKNERNLIYFGVIKTENRENFIKNDNWGGRNIFFQNKLGSASKKTRKPKMQKGKRKMDPKNIPRKNKFKKKRHFHNFS
ncbi:enolase-phosphatase e1 [Anaeramoeba flamelloides]|uniref:Enolase-phosphatase e1 n=1 Tax=Anaeramoeba flamelloides TaxID=1746091 RepID=A0AAV7Y696_9EUKA|nr:enolase-phosphatase e1 [Anaeramoeba flamelloides]